MSYQEATGNLPFGSGAFHDKLHLSQLRHALANCWRRSRRDKFFGMCPDDCYEDCLFVEDGSPTATVAAATVVSGCRRRCHACGRRLVCWLCWLRVTDVANSCPPAGIGRRFADANFPNGSNYATSVIGNATVAWLREILLLQQSQQPQQPPRPFFAFVAPHAPHTAPAGQSMVAPWYTHASFPGGRQPRAPRTAAFGVASPDKHWLVATQPSLTLPLEFELDLLQRMRWQGAC